MHTILTRTTSPEEQRLIAARSKVDCASYGCITIFFGVVPIYLLGKLCGWVGGYISAEAATYGQWFGWSVAAIFFVIVMLMFARFERRRRQHAFKDNKAQIVQEIHVTDPRVIEIALISDNEPILALDVGNNAILFLQGQWLRDPTTYATEQAEDDPSEEFINGLPAPFSFPSSEFTLSRFPNSGEIIGIRVAGVYVAPTAAVEALKPEYEFGDSELFEGSLDDIAGVLNREHKRRVLRLSVDAEETS